MTTFSLAVNKSWTNADGQKQNKTVWFRISCWRKLAEIVSQYCTKGQQVMVVGEIEEARSYTDKNGEARASLEVTAQTVRFLGSKSDNQGNHSQGDPTDNGSVDNSAEIPF